jgi:hypothetical protein
VLAVLGRQRSAFGAVRDLAVAKPDRRVIGDPAAGALASALVYDLSGEGFEDIVAGAPAVDGGAAYISLSPHFSDTHEPNDTAGAASVIGAGATVTSYVYPSNDIDWFTFTLGAEAHVHVSLGVPADGAYALELRDASQALLESSGLPGAGTDQEVLTTLPAGTYFVRVNATGSFSQANAYELRVMAGVFTDAFEPNGTSATAVTIGTLPYQAKIYSPEDVDWYRFSVNGNGTVTLALDVPPSLDLAMSVFTTGGAIVATSDQSGSGVDETITRVFNGPGEYRVRITSGGGGSISDNYKLTISGSVVVSPANQNILLGGGPHRGAGGWFTIRAGAERSYDLTGWGRIPWDAYNATGGGVRLATGDLDGDGASEVVVGFGPGADGCILILDDAAHAYAPKAWVQVPWTAYNSANGETYPAVGDLDGDGRAEIVVGLGSGSSGAYLILDDALGGYRPIAWRQVSWPTYNGGAGETRPAVGDVDGDGRAEIVLGLGRGSRGRLEIVSGALGSNPQSTWAQVPWDSYNAANGTTIPAVGDVDGDGRAEIVVGLGRGSAGAFVVLDDAQAGYRAVRWLQVAWDIYTSQNGETRPAVGNIDGDPAQEIVVALGEFPGYGGWFLVFDDATTNYWGRGWYNVGYAEFTANGGGLYPAIASRR